MSEELVLLRNKDGKWAALVFLTAGIFEEEKT